MQDLKAIKIIHGISDRIDFLFLAEFLRLCGFYVGEQKLSSFSPGKELDSGCFDAYIYVPPKDEIWKEVSIRQKDDGIRNFEALQERFLSADFHEIRMDILPDGENNREIKDISVSDRKKLLVKCLDKIGLTDRVRDDVWSALADIYIKNDLMIHSSSLQYYPMRESAAIQNAEKLFLQAYTQITELLAAVKIQKHLRYAQLWCAVKINSIRKFQKKMAEFPPLELAEKCIKLYKEYPDFSNVKVLEGLCYEHSEDKASEAIYAFKHALNMERSNCYATAIYYWIGKRYEAYNTKKKEAEEYYFKAYRSMPKFRNIYKLAVFAKGRADFETTQKYFTEIIDVLVEPKKLNMLDPLELEYAFKVYQQMCHMYYDKCSDRRSKYEKVIYYAQAAIGARELIDFSIFYDRLYGEENAELYRNISKERMSLDSIYLMLSHSYHDVKEYDIAEKYKNLIAKDGYD